MPAKNQDFQSQTAQLAVLVNEVPAKEEVVISLREAVIEQLQPLLKEALEEARMEIEFSGSGTSYFLNSRGWRAKNSSRVIQSRIIAENCSEEVIRQSVSAGLDRLIKEMTRRGEEASSERSKLLDLLQCLGEMAR